MVIPRSFIFSNEQFTSELKLKTVPSGYLATSGELDVITVGVGKFGSNEIGILIGYAIDMNDDNLDASQILYRIIASVKNHGATEGLEVCNSLLGRYCIILNIGGSWCIVNDACATRTVYFGKSGAKFCISSHSNYAASILQAVDKTSLYHHYKFGLPGIRSPFQGIQVLPANFWLEPVSGKLTRFFPQRERVERPLAEAYDLLEPLLLKAAASIGNRWRPAISLTAGLDSRVSFAAFRSNRSATFFTYDRGRRDVVDVAVSRELCDRYEAAHKRLRSRGRNEAPRVYSIIDKISDYRHAVEICPSYVAHFSEPGWIHVRSNLSEIGRSFWRNVASPKEFSLDRIMRLNRAKSPQMDEWRDEAEKYRLEGFTEYLGIMNYNLIDPANPCLNGYDAWDLFYWEHRMSTWHAQVLLGSDLSFDTAILFNCRTVLDIMLSVTEQERRESLLLKMFISKQAPRLDDIPVNPNPVPVSVPSALMYLLK